MRGKRQKKKKEEEEEEEEDIEDNIRSLDELKSERRPMQKLKESH